MRLVSCLAALALVWPSAVQARATLRAIYRGAGFADATPVEPVGGNAASTLGEQRRAAFEFALSLWAGQIDSEVPIVIDVEFADQSCTSNGAVLASAAPTLFVPGTDRTGAMRLYPSALADSIAAKDLAADEPDIHMTINSAVDAQCKDVTRGFYYGLDRRPGESNDFVDTIMHELGHGLGFIALVDITTGELIDESADPYTALVRDLDLDKTWDQLTAAQRRQSALNVRRLVWDGPIAASTVPRVLRRGQPQLSFDTTPAGYTGFVSDTAYGADPVGAVASGRVVAAHNCTLANVPNTQSWVALFLGCEPSRAARAATEAGAAAALLLSPSRYDSPAMPLEAANPPMITLPLLALTETDAVSIQAALQTRALQATLGGDPQQWRGADAQGRPLLFASRPASRGSSIAHLDTSMRPNQLMEPFAAPIPSHDLTLARAMLLDMGWQSRCGDGRLDPTEQCDDGEANSDTAADKCRRDCSSPRCGDGVRDEGEDCDDAHDNSDSTPNACRTTCTRPRCGDGVVDAREQCDRGKGNSDKERDGCRSDCRTAYCGDGVVDAVEQCDDGKNNDDDRPDACRTDCRTPRCGDGVVDGDEACDDGAKNGAAVANACRRDCTRAMCGDGIVDVSESCDGTPNCAVTCQLVSGVSKAPEYMGGDKPDASAAAEDEPPPEQSSPAAKPEADSGCGCRVLTPEQAGSAHAGYAACLLLVLTWRVRRRLQTPVGSRT